MQVFTPSRHSAETDNNTVLVLRDEVKEKKIGSLYVADQSIEVANQGEIRASVDGSQYEPGQRIVFVKYSGALIELNGIEYILLKEKEIQGTIREVASPSDAKPQTPDDVNAAAQEAL